MVAELRVLRSSEEEDEKFDYRNRYISNEPQTGVLFVDFIESIINRRSKRMGETYKRNYLNLIYNLNNFAAKNNVDLYINSINETFLDDFIVYLESQDLRQTYIKSLLNLAKSMVGKAKLNGYLVDPTYEDVDMDGEEQFSIYLTMNEICRIYYFKGLSAKQEKIKDLFVIGCLTALRYSDYSNLTREDFQGDFIVKTTKKTKRKVVIPVHDFVREIFDKYDGEINLGLSIQHFNRYIKKICHKIGFDEKITISFTRGGKVHAETKLKYELITSHTARRSAATNMYLTGRIKTYEIMSVTGHKTEKSFFRYVRISYEDTATQLKADSFFRK